jgi:Cu/Ag efflux pump CusA
MGLVGALLAVLAAGGNLSFGSYIALFAVFGIATRGCVLLFDRVRQLEQDEGEPFGSGLVVRAARERLTPVVMTALATGLVFLPVLIMGSRAGLELVNPVAVVFFGGLATSAMFSLFVLPVLYLRFGYSRAAEAAEGEELTTALDELARGAVARGPAGDGVTGEAAPGVAVMETRALPSPEGD